MEAIYEFIDAEASESAFTWFNDLAREIYSLERFPERGAVIRKQETSPSAFWEDAQHLQNYLRGG